ncbi:5-oxoprolinase/urea amidolyase family protein [Brucella gallinifaecis]|uniref:5-oxoprolinase/urea amidolyase family protein n=1 Tax=Brucella gallinifaecis TaxID=215590 RepID=A0A502BSF0_9HYPH|nr:urea amidolyase family protein [Brucella gallinifaecis]TPF77145.1 5-oxoprolinase/urea amidolyase family protein [Brucella gallinifaecis]
MSKDLRFLPSGSDSFLVELADLPITLTLFDALQSAELEGVREIIPGARTIMVRFDRWLTDHTKLANQIAALDLSVSNTRSGEQFEIPVTYDGEDLGDVAAFLNCSVEDVIRRHTQATYTVAFTGFTPGFAYMTCDDPGFDVPRRKSPRVKIPAGSVALAGKFGGIYPSDSPGGWQLLGTTPLAMWDTTRERAALLAPGDRVCFRDMASGGTIAVSKPSAAAPIHTQKAEGLLVTRADRPVLFQDMGRPGLASQGVSESGALDRIAMQEANHCVGNPHDTAVIEISFGSFAFKTDRPVTLAVTGAPCPLTIHTPEGQSVTASFAQPIALNAGDELSLAIPSEGMLSYLALRGGFDVEPVLGSASRDTLAKIGPSPVVEGDILAPANRPALAVSSKENAQRRLPRAGETVTLDIVLGPRTDWFTRQGLETLTSQDWDVTPQSSRVGMRLAGANAIERAINDELPSEGTALGAIQVPHTGQPVLFLADHPLTGGYPVIGVVAHHHLDLAGQIPIGARIRFNPITAFEPLEVIA